MSVTSDLELSLDQALADIEAMGAAIEAATTGITVEVAPVDVELTVDTGQVTAEIDGIDAPPIDVPVEVDVAQVEAELDSLPQPDPIDVPVDAPGVEETRGQIEGLADSASEAETSISGLAAGLGAAGLAGALASVVGQAAEASAAVAVTGQIVSNLGGATGTSIAGIEELASSIQSYSGFSDDAIISGAGLVAALGNVANAAGEGNDIFDRAITLSADLAARLGGDVTTAAFQLGRALSDPERGLARLERSLGRFPAAQREMIISLAESGDLLGAQALLLDVLEERIGGVAAAYGGSLAGQIDRAGEQFGEFQEDVGAAVGVLAGPALGAVSSLGEAFQRLSPEVQGAVAAIVAMALAAGAVALALKTASAAATASGLTGLGARLAAVNPAWLLLAATIGATIIVGQDMVGVLGELGEGAREAAAGAVSLAAHFGEQGAIVPALRERIGELAEATDNYSVALDAAGVSQTQFAQFVADTDPSNFFTALADLSPTAQGVAMSLGDLAGSLQDEARAAIIAAVNTGQISQVMLEAVTATLGYTGGFENAGLATTNFVDILGNLPGVASPAEAALGAIAEAARGFAPSLAGSIESVRSAGGALGDFVLATDPQQVIANLQAAIAAFRDFSANLEVINEFGPQVAAALGAIGPEAAGAFAQGLRLLPPAVTEQLNAVLLEADAAGIDFAAVMTGFAEGGVQGAASALQGGAGQLQGAGKSAGDAATQGVKEGLAPMPLTAADRAKAAVAAINAQTGPGRGAGQAVGAGISAGAGAGIGTIGPRVSEPVRRAIGNVDAQKQYASQVGQGVGASLGAGIVSGIDSYVGRIADAARNAVQAAVNAARAAADVGSPSRLFAREVGAPIGEGIALGIADSEGAVVAAAEGIVRAAAVGAGVAATAMSPSLVFSGGGGDQFSSTYGATTVLVDARGAADPDAVGAKVGQAVEAALFRAEMQARRKRR